MDYRLLGSHIRARRKALSLTLEELAYRANLSTSFLGHIEHGKRKPSLGKIVDIAHAMQVSVDDLIGLPRETATTFDATIQELERARMLIQHALELVQSIPK